MSKGYAVLAGLKEVDPGSYGGWNGQNGCWGCELDVDNMRRILDPLGFGVGAVLKTADATALMVLANLEMTVSEMSSGDLLVFYFSGHGGQQPDENGDELDGKDETLICYDRPIVDDELDEIWLRAPAGARIIMVSDSCNSGTNYRGRMRCSTCSPFLPVVNAETKADMVAQLIHLGGCRDGGTSSGYQSGGAFTMALCDIWANSYPFDSSVDPRPTCKGLLAHIAVRLTTQTPQYGEYGVMTAEFRDARAFQIKLKPAVAVPEEPEMPDTETGTEEEGEEDEHQCILGYQRNLATQEILFFFIPEEDMTEDPSYRCVYFKYCPGCGKNLNSLCVSENDMKILLEQESFSE